MSGRLAYDTPRIVESRRILEPHATELAASAIDLATAGLSGVYSINHATAYDFGIRSDGSLGGLCFRYWDPAEQRFSDRFVRVKLDHRVSGRKYLQPVGERPRLYFVGGTGHADLADPEVPVFITEGEKKTLALCQAAEANQIRALVVGVGGVWGWRWSDKELKPDGKLGKGKSRAIPDFDLIRWMGRAVYIFFDSDVSTNWKVEIAETSLAKELARRGGRVHIVRLPTTSPKKLGVDDLITERGPELLPTLLQDAWPYDGYRCPKRVHLSDVENAALGRRRIVIDIIVSAVGESYLVPQTVDVQCHALEVRSKRSQKPKLHIVRDDEPNEARSESAGSQSPLISCSHMEKNEGRWTFDLHDPEMLIDLTRVTWRLVRGRLQKLAEERCPNARVVGVRTNQTVTAFLGTPKARRWRAVLVNGRSETQDEMGRPFREKVLYYQGTIDSASKSYRAVGMALPNPKSQEATAFIWGLKPLVEDYETFRVTPEVAERFAALRVTNGKSLRNQLLEIRRDLTDHVTNIYGEHRELALQGKLLVFHSVRQFRFDGELLKRGWLEMLEIGDTGQGKTQQVERLMGATGLGEGVDGVSTTRTGLAYSYQKLGDMWFLVWGRYPLNDGRLLFIDEAQNLRPEDIDKIRKGRSDGTISASGVKNGEHPSRTRLIACCNPRHQGVVDDEMFGIELLRQTFKDEDIRRFDFAVISSSSDHKGDINKGRPAPANETAKITPATLADSIKWAWSRSTDQVTFTAESTRSVYTVASTLVGFYGEARDIPLMLESDARHKVARLAVAMAALVHSTDERHETIVVRTEHVDAVGDFLVQVYNHSNTSLDLYAKIRREEASLSDAEYQDLWETLRAAKIDKGSSLSDEKLEILLRAFVFHGGRVSRQDLAGELGTSLEWTSKIVGVLKSERLVRVAHGRRGGYQATPKFTKFLKRAIQDKAIES